MIPAALIALALRNWKAIALVAVVVAGLASALAYRHHLIERGAAVERARVEQANDEARRKADAGQATLDDCLRAGRDWDRARGVCLPAGR